LTIEYYDKSIHLNPNGIKNYYDKASVLIKQEKYEEAKLLIKKILGFDPKF